MNKTGVFRRWILDWNAKTQVQKTWTNFKIHFRQAQQELRETTSLQQRQSTFQANAVQEFFAELKSELRNDHLQVQHASNLQVQPPSDVPSAASVSTFSSDASSIISALQSELSSLKELVQHIAQPSLSPQYQATPTPNWMYPPPQFFPPPQQMYAQQVTPAQESAQRPKKIYYCWTHGACYHSSDRCRKRAPGHQPTATLSNRQDGSLKNVRLPSQVPTQPGTT